MEALPSSNMLRMSTSNNCIIVVIILILVVIVIIVLNVIIVRSLPACAQINDLHLEMFGT